MPDDRDYELVLWGATGFTGRLTAEYLAERYEVDELDWAIAGRNRGKLERLRDDLGAIDPGWASLDVLAGDAFDRERLAAIAGRTRVVCTTVGPYARYGTPLVEACIDRRTDYCDLAGEVHWLRRVIDEYHEAARERGVRIVHACGFDSVPSDLGTLLVQRHAEDTLGSPCSTVRSYVSTGSLNLGGGTAASMLELYEALSRNPGVREVLANPYSLAPEGERSGPDDGSRRGPRYDAAAAQWTAPFLMAAVNEKVVHRSNALLGYPWGRDFRYEEVEPTGTGLPGAVRAAGKAGGLALTAASLSVSPLRKLADRFVLPDPGEGPSREAIEDGSFAVRFRGAGRSPGSDGEFTAAAIAAANRDPGYGATARMLAEAGICLATGATDTPLDGGVLTPATGIGTPLADRLRPAGVRFDVGRDVAGGGAPAES